VIRDIKRKVGVVVVGNGDLWYASDARAMFEQTGCDAVMVGRPALRNPWIFQQLAAAMGGAPAFEPDGAALLDHFERFVVASPVRQPAALAGLLKEQLRYVTRAVPLGADLLKQLQRIDAVGELLHALETALSGLRAADLDLGMCPRQPGQGMELDDKTAPARYAAATPCR
jgi:tRNA-dihydrouridine synthase